MRMNFFGPTKPKSLSGNRFVFVLVDDFLDLHGFSFWNKDKAFSHFFVFRKRVEKEKDFLILCIGVIEVVNSLTILLSPIVKRMELNMNYLVLEFHNKIE